ncbi:MAG: efflux RND transporter periplasmic adaptor subunit [Chlorobi bacterium]|nr:efflux RND transporter periplasmic adaptor subunit [Chlorobiota bacterium]
MATKERSRPAKRKRRSGLILMLILLGLVVIVGLIMALGGGEEEGFPVEVAEASLRTITETVIAPGVVEPETQIVISSEVSGEIVYLAVEEGDRVSKGKVLVRINPESIVAQREQVNAQILSAKSQVSSASASLLKAQSEYERLKKLHEKKLITDQEIETAELQVKINEAQLEAAEYQVRQSQANYRQVQESVKKTTIIAPISGVVTRLNVKEGEKVVGAIQMTGTEIMTIADLSVIEAVVDVVETDVVGIDIGDEAEVEVDALPNETFRALVSRIANSPKQSGMGTQDQLINFEVRLRFLDPDTRFRPGMSATGIITTQSKTNVISVPIQAVTIREEKLDEEVKDEEVQDLRLEREKSALKPKTVLFLVDGDSVLQQEITTGLRDDQYIEITSGLAERDIVVSGSYKAISKELEDGMQIKIKNEIELTDDEQD